MTTIELRINETRLYYPERMRVLVRPCDEWFVTIHEPSGAWRIIESAPTESKALDKVTMYSDMYGGNEYRAYARAELTHDHGDLS